jgi:hypothetical protein
MRYFELYRRDAPAGRVILGANDAAGAEWDGTGMSHYIVVVISE